ncbi:hypothetical protein K443DRAFT_4775 [Laccaria amethystina LaAM-08-1]|uniref:Uncharacterized protein n=1 Tax=Laccaria amethystina LaAM-08-1 TaxID=1095629 RepID=A0A0C9WX65_9AGAR|nr:hypothetical protein K443DRAFT_4775 [Laccaria amethystina LaAM-08-1]
MSHRTLDIITLLSCDHQSRSSFPSRSASVQTMELTSVPVLELAPPYDIKVYLKPNSVALIVGTSLQKTRSVKEFLDLLKAMIIPTDFHLQTFQDRQDVDIEGTIHPGEYLIVEAQKYYCQSILTFRKEATLLRGTPPSKKRKLSTTDSPEGGRSQRLCQLNFRPDDSKESAGFKSRLIARDKGCVVCMAQNQDDD